MPPKPHPVTSLPFSERAQLSKTPPLASYLLNLISVKRTNLCVAADVQYAHELLRVAEEVGDYICVLKTHADAIDDFSDQTIKGLQEISSRKRFLLFEDRKFGDIGNTVQAQYTRGPLSIATWAHLTNVHLFPGPSIIPALHTAALTTLTSLNQSVATTITTGTPRLSLDSNDPSPSNKADTSPSQAPHRVETSNSSEAATTNTDPRIPILFSHNRRHGTATATTTISQTFEPASPTQPASLTKPISEHTETSSALESLGPPPHARGLLLLAQMSTAENLMTPAYTNACVAAARQNKDFVIGFVAQESLNQQEGDSWITFAPGVGLGKEGGDGKGQLWRGPEEVVGRDGVDVVIVGRGVLGAEDRGREAERYRRGAWEAYERRVGGQG